MALYVGAVMYLYVYILGTVRHCIYTEWPNITTLHLSQNKLLERW